MLSKYLKQLILRRAAVNIDRTPTDLPVGIWSVTTYLISEFP